MNEQWKQVKEFHQSFGHPVSEVPVLLTKDRAIKRHAWMLEEINEFISAVDKQDIVECSDAMIDLIYFALGTLVEMGIEPDQLFEIVQQANMSKLWEDGKPHYNEMGKVIKPASWVDPHERLKSCIVNMGEQSRGNQLVKKL